MNLMDLSFLQDVEVEAVKKTAAKERVATPKLPETADLRVFGNGNVYPSKAFAEANDLEFSTRLVVTEEGKKDKLLVPGNGIDIFSSLKWGAVQGKLPQEVVFLAVVPKAEAKVDMWASTKYNDDETPKASVFTQGSSVFSKEVLISMLAEVYGVDWDTVQYVDLIVVKEQPMRSPNAVYHFPKIVSSGKFKGEDDYVRRENVNIYPLIISNTVLKDVKEVAVPAAFNKEASAKPALFGEDVDAGSITTEEEAANWAAGMGSDGQS